MSDYNQKVIAEFRANKGAVEGPMGGGAALLLLHTVGAKSGEPRINPMIFQPVGDAYAVFATFRGGDKNPAWYHNLVANPNVEAEIGADTVQLVARVAEGEERETIWEQQKAVNAGFADYDTQTTRTIPVVILERR